MSCRPARPPSACQNPEVDASLLACLPGDVQALLGKPAAHRADAARVGRLLGGPQPDAGAGQDGRCAALVRGHLGPARMAGAASRGGGYGQRVAARDRHLRAGLVAGRDGGDARKRRGRGRAGRARRPVPVATAAAHEDAVTSGQYAEFDRSRGGAGPAVRGSTSVSAGRGHHRGRIPGMGCDRPRRDHRFRPAGVRPRRAGPVPGRAHRDGRSLARLPGLCGTALQVSRRPERFPGRRCAWRTGTRRTR